MAAPADLSASGYADKHFSAGTDPTDSSSLRRGSLADTSFGHVAEMDGTPSAEASAPDSAAAVDVASPPHTSAGSEAPKQVQDVLQSEIGIVTMLNRLKQSIGTSKEFALFLKKRAALEEEHAAGMRKLARATQESMVRSDHAQDTFGLAVSEMMDIHTRMADNSYQFTTSLHQMHEDLLELAAIAEKNRKGWKQTGLAAEQRVADLEAATRKSKAKYDALADEYDRVRTGDVSGRRGGFGFKGPKSAAQQEEDLLRKVQLADEDYHSRVDTLAREREKLLSTERPEIVKALQDLVHECDGGLVLQVQKYASFSEKLLLSNGLCISPIKSAQKPGARSLREVVIAIDADRDLNNYIGSAHGKIRPETGEPKYERHHVLGGSTSGHQPSQLPPPSSSSASQHPPATAASMRSHTASQSVSQANTYGGGRSTSSGADDISTLSSSASPAAAAQLPPLTTSFGAMPPPPLQQQQQHERSFSSSSAYGHSAPGWPTQAPPSAQSPHQPLTIRNSVQPLSPRQAGSGSMGSAGDMTASSSRFYSPAHMANGSSSSASQGPPQLGALSFQTGPPLSSSTTAAPLLATSVLPSQRLQQQPQPLPPSAANPLIQHPPTFNGGGGSMGLLGGHPGTASRAVFGVSLETLYDRDNLAVPMVVYECIQAVDLFGLGVEGIYRLSGSLPHVNKLKAMFDTDSASPDFRNPENFFHDVNSVAGLLKQFFRDLPDPLLTRKHYDRFIEAAKQEDDVVRRDSLHAVINDLPDPNYATLRALVLHLNRVVENASVNRMTAQNLAIVFGPTLMGAGTGDPEKGRWHVRVIDTILQNTYQIFDED